MQETDLWLQKPRNSFSHHQIMTEFVLASLFIGSSNKTTTMIGSWKMWFPRWQDSIEMRFSISDTCMQRLFFPLSTKSHIVPPRNKTKKTFCTQAITCITILTDIKAMIMLTPPYSLVINVMTYVPLVCLLSIIYSGIFLNWLSFKSWVYEF